MSSAPGAGATAALGSQDLHVHTTMSDGEVPLMEVVKLAAERGTHIGIADPLSTDLPAEIMDRFDYRIGSNHGFSLPGGGLGSPWWTTLPEPWDSRPQELMEVMVANLCDLVASMPIEIVAHSTFMPAALMK